jgi:hypothetical protein
MWTMKAVAIGDPAKDGIITSKGQAEALGRRQYVVGLIDGLNSLDTNPPSKYRIGTDYQIDYRETAATGVPATFSSTDPLIFAMSTTIVAAAQTFTTSIPIVGIVSDPDGENFRNSKNICGVTAQRHQMAGTCLDDFLNTVTSPGPYITSVVALCKPNYNPSDQAWALVQAEAKKKQPPILPINITPYDYTVATQPIDTWLNALPVQPANTGLLVLPVDLFFANAAVIIDLAQNTGLGVSGQKLPTFFFAPDWVGPVATESALGAYGVSQYTCGELMANLVNTVRTSGVPTSAAARWTPAPPTAFQWVTNKTVASTFGYVPNTQAPPNGPNTAY